ncbi:sensor histidine kinase [Halalkalibacter okhensis]|uniref:histidine kinase n=1 Tax=Halalkalibacter okhensis TaxID=333138 RepID=A0A0B0IKE6_9BACI|nr:sensor histidine kinase [Halalkalibacter okhensis]KHF41327.1 hypothetical protein LQ50_03575 [Halalkalibacter okhensis]
MSEWFYHLSLKTRILIYFAFVIILAIAFASFLIYMQATAQIKKQAEMYLEHIVENTSFQTDRYIRDLELATLSLLTDRKAKEFLDLGETQAFERYSHYNDILKEMNKIHLQNYDIQLVYLLGENNQLILSDRGLSNDRAFPTEEVYKKLLLSTPESGRISLIANKSLYNNEYVISVTRRLRGVNSFVPKGILGVEINASAMEQLWNITQLNKDTTVYIVGEDGRIVYHPNENWLGKRLDESLGSKMAEQENGTFNEMWEDEDMMFYYNRSAETGWTLVAMTPVKSVLEPVSGIKHNAIIASFAVLLVAMGISTGLARSVVVPLQKVQMGMKKIETGEWEKIKSLKGSDEISCMVNSYNIMVSKLSQLVEELYESELHNQEIKIEKQKTELQALQSQINPHFLHNTLETMNAYAVLNESEEISEMAEALSNMFRYSIRNFEVVTLKDELNHIRNFLIVQQHRFQKKINISFEIEEQLFNEDIAKLTLQPLVENAIHHGLRKNRYQGNISIRAGVTNNVMEIKVIDNGAGISVERMKEIKEKLSAASIDEFNQTMGIGVMNVHRRIQLIFGQEYGLEISGEEGVGTTVTMTIPRTIHYKGSA